MSRKSREKSNSGIYHLMLRGNNKQNLFGEDEDRLKFIEKMQYYKTISHYYLYSYCLMDNHVHLLIQETDESLAQVIKRISSSYVRWYNKKYERCGHLFQERFKSEIVENDVYFLTVLRYIHQNPVKAGIVDVIDAYRWSSYLEYINVHHIIDVDFAFNFFSRDRMKAIKLFKEYNNQINSDHCLDYQKTAILADQEIVENFRRLGITTMDQFERINKAQRDCIIKQVKKLDGVTIRQLARITGLSKSVIDRM